ncbi:MAG: hypothetical protein EOM50_07075 [Erysipelotrichia bacterium]|nr:hypothetical protein [Erysipelotrichia bacterium]
MSPITTKQTYLLNQLIKQLNQKDIDFLMDNYHIFKQFYMTRYYTPVISIEDGSRLIEIVQFQINKKN